jgi:hypothetical protein
MKFSYEPYDIVLALCGYVGQTSQEAMENATDALYHLKTICENKYNNECFRYMYKLLEQVTEKMEVERC